MGQYYSPKIGDIKYSTECDMLGSLEYFGSKLMEHSWWYNPLVNALSETIYENPQTVMWLGDYSDEYELYESLAEEIVEVNNINFTLDGLYIVNHTKKIYLDCSKYKKDCTLEYDREWIVHPLPLLTSCGNGRGGGDYHGINSVYCGFWSGDLISIESKLNKFLDYDRFDIVFES